MNAYNNFFFKAGISFLLISFLTYVSCFGNVASLPPSPSNDECSDAISISVDTTNNFVSYSNNGATASAGVLAPLCANYVGGDVWFKVVVPASGHLVFESQNLGIGNSGMAIYSGSCSALSLIACDAYGNYNNTMPLIDRTGLTPGATIYIRFWKNGSVLGGDFGLSVYEPHAPVNDDCAGAILLNVDTACSFSYYSSFFSTASTNVPAPGCANYIGGDVWFSVIVPATGRLIFESQGLGMLDGGMAIYSGGCGSLTLIACDDNSSSYTTFMPMINQAGLISGTTIYIRFWASSSPIGGTFNLCVYNPPIPLNDECSGAIAITADTTFTYTTYTNIGATSSLGVTTPSCANYQGGDVWFSVIVPPMGHLIFSSQDQGIVDGGMAIYSGNCGSLNLISCNDNISLSSLMPKIDIYNLIPGTAIYIRFWKNGTSLGGAFGLNVYYPPPPINDDCSGAITIFADTICTYHTFTTSGATPSSGVSPPTCANNVIADVWIKVVVPTQEI